MNLKSALDWLYSTQLFGIKLGLEGTRRLLEAADAYPSEDVCVVHVAGTNGKGSVCAMLEALGRSSGLKTGMFTSPHLVDFRERIRVNGVMIPEDALLRLLVEVRDLVAEWDPHPTFFELALAVALKYFKECGVKFLVLDTGLGGCLDATNAVPKDLAVLAPIGMDHQQYLGDTLELIAAEKAGIIAAGRPVVSAVQEPEAAGVIARRAAELGSPLAIAGHTDGVPQPSLPGAHQRRNAALALLAMKTLHLLPSRSVAEAALSSLSWPGRFQELEGGLMVLDGAHNPHAARVLAETWRERFGDDKAALVFAASADKNIHGVLELIAPLAGEWHLVPCTSPRILGVGDMKCLVEAFSSVPVICHDSLETGLKAARNSGCRVLVTGSLFLLGDVLGLFAGEGRRATVQ